MTKEDKNEKMIMVVDKDALLGGNNYFIGFMPHREEINYEKKVLENLEYMKRGLAEQDVSKKQPIAYAIIANRKEGKVFAYQRSQSTKAHGDERLQNKWSWGVGGHIEQIDEATENPILHSMIREISEEIALTGVVNTSVLGYINDDSNEVGKVHFGILYLIEIDSNKVKPKSEELKVGKMVSLQELERMSSSSDYTVEDWSKIALNPLKDLMK